MQMAQWDFAALMHPLHQSFGTGKMAIPSFVKVFCHQCTMVKMTHTVQNQISFGQA
jgi:hypothetical protein